MAHHDDGELDVKLEQWRSVSPSRIQPSSAFAATKKKKNLFCEITSHSVSSSFDRNIRDILRGGYGDPSLRVPVRAGDQGEDARRNRLLFPLKPRRHMRRPSHPVVLYLMGFSEVRPSSIVLA